MLYRYQLLTQAKYIFYLFGLMVAVTLSPREGLGGIHFTLQSSLSQNNMLLSAQDARSGSASVAFDLGTYFRIGLTHRQAINLSRGYYFSEENQSFEYRLAKTRTDSNSLDFTIILYYGQIFVPYLQVGLVKKHYHLSSVTENLLPDVSESSLLVPNGGIGMGIRINRNFSLKLSVSVSKGHRMATPDAPIEDVYDTFTSMGVTYNI